MVRSLVERFMIQFDDMIWARSYLEGVKMGFLTENPAGYHDPNVCAPYINNTKSTKS